MEAAYVGMQLTTQMQLGPQLRTLQFFFAIAMLRARCCASVLQELLALLVVYVQEAGHVCSHF